MRPRPVGHLWWLTGLGPPVVLQHAGGPPSFRNDHSVDRDTSFDHGMIGDAHRVPVESLDRARSGESAQRISELDLVHVVETTCTRLRRAVRNLLWRLYAGRSRSARRASRSDYNRRMKGDAAEILKAALALPADKRAALAASLLDSLDPNIDEDAEASWAIEVNRRVAELDGRAVKTMPWADVRRRLVAR